MIKSKFTVLFAIVFALIIAAGCGSVTDAGLTKAPANQQELNASGKNLSISNPDNTVNNNKGYDGSNGTGADPIIIR